MGIKFSFLCLLLPVKVLRCDLIVSLEYTLETALMVPFPIASCLPVHPASYRRVTSFSAGPSSELFSSPSLFLRFTSAAITITGTGSDVLVCIIGTCSLHFQVIIQY